MTLVTFAAGVMGNIHAVYEIKTMHLTCPRLVRGLGMSSTDTTDRNIGTGSYVFHPVFHEDIPMGLA